MTEEHKGDQSQLDLMTQISALREQIRTLNHTTYHTSGEKKKQSKDLSNMRLRFEQLQQQADEIGVAREPNKLGSNEPTVDYEAESRARIFNAAAAEYITALAGSDRLQTVDFLDQPPLSSNQIVITSGHLAPVVGILSQLGEADVLNHMTFIQGVHNPEGANQAAIVNTDDLLATLLKHRDNNILIQEVMKDVQQEISIMNVAVLARMVQREEAQLKEAEENNLVDAAHELRNEVWSLKYRMRRLYQMAGPIKKLVQDAVAAGLPISTLLEPGQVDGVTMDFDTVILASCDKNLLEGDYTNSDLKTQVDAIIADCNLHDQELAS